MPEEALEERVAAVERAVSDADGLPDGAVGERSDLRDRVDALEDDVAELEAAVQAVRGYVGGVRHVNDEVEQRADAAMAKVQALERAFEGGNKGEPADGARADAPADRESDMTGVGDAAPRGGGRHSDAGDGTSGPEASHADGDPCPWCGTVASTDDAPVARSDGAESGVGHAASRGVPTSGDRPTGATERPSADGGSSTERRGPRSVIDRGSAGVGEDQVGGHSDTEEPTEDGLLARFREVL